MFTDFFHPQLWFQPRPTSRPSLRGEFCAVPRPRVSRSPHRKMISGAIFSVPYTMWDVTRKHVFFWSNDSLPQLEHHGNFLKSDMSLTSRGKGFFCPEKMKTLQLPGNLSSYFPTFPQVTIPHIRGSQIFQSTDPIHQFIIIRWKNPGNHFHNLTWEGSGKSSSQVGSWTWNCKE